MLGDKQFGVNTGRWTSSGGTGSSPYFDNTDNTVWDINSQGNNTFKICQEYQIYRVLAEMNYIILYYFLLWVYIIILIGLRTWPSNA